MLKNLSIIPSSVFAVLLKIFNILLPVKTPITISNITTISTPITMVLTVFSLLLVFSIGWSSIIGFEFESFFVSDWLGYCYRYI